MAAAFLYCVVFTSLAQTVNSVITGNITCDNIITFYANGKQRVPPANPSGSDTNWRVSSEVIIPRTTRVYAIMCIDHGVVGGIVASFSNRIVTDGSWKCTTEFHRRWNLARFNDSSWPAAHVIGAYGTTYPWYDVPQVGTGFGAKWIWTTRGKRGTQGRVYCRKTDFVDDCPAVNPCNGHGVCVDLDRDYRCVCESQYGGKDCQTDCSSVDYCPVRYHDDVPATLSITEHDGASVDVEIPVILESGVFGRDWIVVLRRIDGSENFTRGLADYKHGFGDFKGEFWLGNEALHLLTYNGSRWRLRMDMVQQLGSTQEYRYAEYTNFSVSHESDNYRLTVTGYSGNAGDAMADHNNRVFKSIDSPCTPVPFLGYCLPSCVEYYKFGWWFSRCGKTFPTGDYFNARSGIIWQTWIVNNPLEYIDMKIKPYP